MNKNLDFLLKLRLLLAFFITINLSACGFHMRGLADVPFKSVYFQGNTIIISKQLNKTLNINGVKILQSVDDADLMIDILGEESEKRILSLSGQGKVNEYELYYRVHYRTRQTSEALWSQVNTVEARRDYSYSDAETLAKQGEEKRLNEDMQNDVVNNMMRRLSVLKKRTNMQD